MIFYFIIAIGLAWLFQSIFGFWQIRHFNQTFAEYRKLGRVAVGRRTGLFRAGTVVLFVIDKRNKILRASKMQGVTVFSRIRPLKGFEGKYLLKIGPDDLSPHDRLTRLAIEDALRTFDIITKGGDIPPKKSLLQKIMSVHTKKRGEI
ncbi:transcriptional regulator GutM [Bacillus swezeyi]|uniref:Transcriptional regulator n=1 Tax=Bacillus swezeyi TaxID=1925020 RepID=A0A5M8RYM0_9BACI|nr:transcriptional regulator GutM [Bacillus swezeyi]KAA6450902.1 transcriptional regulator [Bacillus swezeyi]KAA6474899.1 transcriptional regulator [Bacillus swezeyi]TYS37435.1 transcriptional regulator [Bacillus swezeyi]